MVNVQGPRRLRRYEHRETIQRFVGLNNEVQRDLIRDNEFSELINFNITTSHTLEKRPGFKPWSPQTGVGAVNLLTVYDTGTQPQIIANHTSAVSNGTFASTDGGITWPIVISATRAFRFAVQYNSVVYLVDGTGVAKWNGATLTAITGSPGGSHIVAFKDRLWVCDGATTSNLYYSDPGPAGVEVWGVSSIIKIRTGDPSSLVASLPFADRLMLFKTMTVWQLFLAGNVASWQLRILNTERGAISENAVLTFQGLIYMLSWDGVWRSDGSVFKELSNTVRKYFKQSPQPYRDFQSAISLSKRRLFVCYRQYSQPAVNGVIPCAYLWYNLDAGGWSEMQLADGVAEWRPMSIFQWYNPGTITSLPPTLELVDSWNVGVVDSRTVMVLDDIVPQDMGFNFNAHLSTKILDFGDSFDIKRAKLMLLDADGAGAIPKVTYCKDNQFDYIAIPAGSLIIDKPRMYRVVGPGYFRQMNVEIDDSSDSFLRILDLNFTLMLKSVIGENT